MKLRSIASVAAAACVVAIAGPAAAQDTEVNVDIQRQRQADRAMGLRFETSFNRNFNLVGFGSGSAEGIATSLRDLPTPNPHGDIKIGYDLPMGLTPLIGLGYVSFSNDQYSDDDEDELVAGESQSAFVLDVELRWYFKPHRANAMQPFVFGEFNTAFTTVSVDSDAEGFNEDDFDDANEAAADELNWTAVNLGLGMEYKFAQGFAIGGKWGLGMGFTGTAVVEDSDPQEGSNTSQTTIGTSAAIYAAWRL